MRAAWFALMVIVACGAWADSQQPTPQIKSTKLATKHADPKQTPPEDVPTTQQITDAIANGIERAEEKHEASHPPMPPDNSSFLFNLLLVMFNGLLVAVGIAQGLLFFFTLRVTEKAANAAKRSADAAVGVAIPKLILSHMYFQGTAANLDGKLQSPNIDARVTNYGNTFAVPKSQALEIVCADHLPEEPEYKNAVRIPFAGKIVEKGREWEFAMGKRPFFSTEDIEAIKAGNKFLWVYGYIFYEDFLDDLHVRRFCQRLHITRGGGGYMFADDPIAPKKYTESY